MRCSDEVVAVFDRDFWVLLLFGDLHSSNYLGAGIGLDRFEAQEKAG